MEYDFDKYLELPFAFEDEIRRIYSEDSKITIFEIGSCEGEDTIKLQRRFPNAKIFAFEPLPKNILRIKNNLKKHSIGGVSLHQIALSNNNGTAEFHVSSGHPDEQPVTDNWDFGNKSSSLLAPKEHKNTHKWIKFDKKIKVKTQRLDDFSRENNINSIDFIYMDVQGAELMVLEGAGEYLKKVNALWLEVEAIELYAGQPLKDEVELFMKKNGFVCIKSTVGDVSGDQFYIRKSLKNKKLSKKIKNIFSSLGNKI